MAELDDTGKAPPGMLGLRFVGVNPHVVDELIAERGQKLVNSRAFPLLKPLLYRILRYREAVRMADELAPLSGPEAMDHMANILSLNLEIEGLEHIPRHGGFVIAANHPTGIADGVAVYQALRTVRPDFAIFTNRDVIRINPRFADYLIPVEWREAFRTLAKTRETLRLSSRAFEEGRAVVLFPSGRIAFWKNGRLNERPWQASAVTLARKQDVPILPVHVRARNSPLFYWFGNSGFTELRDMTVFHELLNKKGKTFGVRFGPLIGQDQLAGDPVEVTERLQAYVVDDLGSDPRARFKGAEA